MKHLPSNSEIITFLSEVATENATFVQSLKIKYRPIICPFDELLSYVKKGDKVFDIGCGSGQFGALVSQYTSNASLKGIEIDEHLVQNAKKISKKLANKKPMKFAIFDGKTLPKDIKDYDLIYMIDVYHHIPTDIRQDFMKQVYERMKPGARLMFKDMNAGSPFLPFNKLHDLIFARELPHEISHKKAEALLSDLGFKIKKSYTRQVYVYPHYFILAQK